MRLGKTVVLGREVISEGADASPYMVRYRIIDTPWFGVYLHHILRSDRDRHLHDHPFSFISVMLWGRYGEVRFAADRWDGAQEIIKRRAPSICFRSARHAHRLLLIKPCWTLVFRGPRRRAWGFWTDDGWKPAAQYLAINTQETTE